MSIYTLRASIAAGDQSLPRLVWNKPLVTVYHDKMFCVWFRWARGSEHLGRIDPVGRPKYKSEKTGKQMHEIGPHQHHCTAAAVKGFAAERHLVAARPPLIITQVS